MTAAESMQSLLSHAASSLNNFDVIDRFDRNQRLSHYSRGEEIPKFVKTSGPILQIDCVDSSRNESHSIGPSYKPKQAMQS